MTVWDQCKQVVNKRKLENEKNYCVASKERLRRIIERKLRTTFIGDIAAIERNFGHLWGIGKSDDECTENQLKWRDVWELLRNTILNKGNAQIRALDNELEQYDIKWNRYKYEVKNVKE
jgi:hypothetical protein